LTMAQERPEDGGDASSSSSSVHNEENPAWFSPRASVVDRSAAILALTAEEGSSPEPPKDAKKLSSSRSGPAASAAVTPQQPGAVSVAGMHHRSTRGSITTLGGQTPLPTTSELFMATPVSMEELEAEVRARILLEESETGITSWQEDELLQRHPSITRAQLLNDQDVVVLKDQKDMLNIRRNRAYLILFLIVCTAVMASLIGVLVGTSVLGDEPDAAETRQDGAGWFPNTPHVLAVRDFVGQRLEMLFLQDPPAASSSSNEDDDGGGDENDNNTKPLFSMEDYLNETANTNSTAPITSETKLPAQLRAFIWLAEEIFPPRIDDSVNSSLAPLWFSNYSDEELLERFAAATLYFSTNKGLDQANRSSRSWTASDNWLTHDVHLCEWYTTRGESGIFAADCQLMSVPQDAAYFGQSFNDTNQRRQLQQSATEPIMRQQRLLQTLELEDNGLHGILPDLALGLLRQLTVLNVRSQGDKLWGTIPTSFRFLTNLQELYLDHNNFTGPALPSELGRLSLLQEYHVQNNRRPLNGSIPSTIGAWTDLRHLSTSDVAWTGAIPTETGQVRKHPARYCSPKPCSLTLVLALVVQPGSLEWVTGRHLCRIAAQ
jgi:hypothetical protein